MKLLLFKILSICLSFTLLNSGSNFFEEFENNIINGYEQYLEIVDENNSNDKFTLKIYQGINDGYESYAIVFKSVENDKYQIILNIDEQYYELSKNDEGYQYAYAIKSTSIIFIKIIDEKGTEVEFNGTRKLNKFTIEEGDLRYQNGNNQKKEFTSLNVYKKTIPFFTAILISSVSIIVMCGAGVLILFIRRKGMFNKKVRSEGIINIADLINQAKEKEEIDILADYKPVETIENNEEIVIEEKEEYIDLNAYLNDKGYLLDYSLLSEEEKNKLMVELMILKNSGKISEDTYNKETCKLWKK